MFAFVLCLCCPVCRYRPCDGLIPRPRSPTDCLSDYECSSLTLAPAEWSSINSQLERFTARILRLINRNETAPFGSLLMRLISEECRRFIQKNLS
jgi:hypothetical protein